jgi:DNA-binding CsgD family transcriptional regulator
MAESALAADPVSAPDLAARLHAAVDDVLRRYDCEHVVARADREVLSCLREVEETFLKTPPQAGQLVQIERAPRPPARMLDAATATTNKNPDPLSAGQLAPTGLLTRPSVEVRILPGLTTWLAVIDSSAVVLPKRHDQPGRERTVSRSPAVLAVASWAFHHARPALTPTAGGVLPQLSQLEVRILRCLSAGLKDEQAARRLEISVRTYRRRVTALCARLHASSRFEAGVAAAKRGLV